MSLRRAWRQLLAGLLVTAGGLAGSALGPATALAAAEPEVVAAEVGWGGQAKAGTWAPVRLRLRGGAEDRTVRAEAWLELVDAGPRGGQPVRILTGSYGAEVALPAGVEKDLTLWVPLTGEVEVRLIAGDRLLASRPVKAPTPRDPEVPMVGVLVRDPGLAQALRGVTVSLQGLTAPVPVAELTPETIPDSGDRLSAFQALVIQGGRGAELTQAQRRAIADWVRVGGLLVLSGGPTLADDLAALAGEALPLRVEAVATGTDLAPLARLAGAAEAPPAAPTPVARLRPEGGAVLAGSPEAPLVWRGSLGNGSVTVLAADLALAPLAQWPGRTGLLQAVLAPTLAQVEGEEGGGPGRWPLQQRLESLAQLTDLIPPEAFPGWQTVALILGGFALLAGPVAHGMLARLQRHEWVWGVVPALALVTGLALYLVGGKVQGRDLLVHLVSHITLDGRGGGQQTLAAGFFAPSREELVVRLPKPVPVRVAGLEDTAFVPEVDAAVPQEPPYRVVTGRETTVMFRSGQWQMRPVVLSRRLDGSAGRIAADLRIEGSAVVGTVANETGWHLEDAAVLLGLGTARLGDLPPGARREVRLSIDAAQNPFGHSVPVSWRILGRERQDGGGPGSGGPPGWDRYAPPPQDAETSRRVQIVDRLLQQPGPGLDAARLPLTFLAFTRDPVGEELVVAPDRRLHALSLVEQRLTLNLPPGPFRLPPGIVLPTMAEGASHGWGGGSTQSLSWMEIQEGQITFAYVPPLPDGARVDALEVTARLVADPRPSPGRGGDPPGAGDPQPVPPPAGIFTIYNWASATWEPLPPGKEVVRIEPAARYVGPGGEVRVRVSAPAGQLVRFVEPQVGFEGKVRR